MSTVRQAAARALVAVERRRLTLPHAVDRERRGLPDRRDRALLLELAAGTLRWRNAIDFVLASASRRPLDELAPPVRAILRLGAFQLRHLERVPDHAVIHEAVESTRGAGHPRAAGFVNAVLRALARPGGATPLPARPDAGASREAQLAYLSITLSHPEWLAARWLDRCGFDHTEAWCRFNNQPPDVTVRLARADGAGPLSDAGATFRPARHVAGAWVVDAGGLGRLSPTLRDRIVVQDEGSQLIARATPVDPGARVLDLCAAPGNKTTILAERLGGRGALVACDLRPRRLAMLARTLAASGARASIVRLDATRPLPFAAAFDTVLLDAPCSGLGTLRRDPDLKWSRVPSDLPVLAARQAAMIRQAASVVRPGGRLVYATCSGEPEENEDVVDAFLAGRPDFESGSLEPDEGATVRNLDELLDARGRLHTLPYRHQMDAFFAAVLVCRRAA
jgi:16S rRNA (cytosine967-C5)-methyltransferase